MATAGTTEALAEEARAVVSEKLQQYKRDHGITSDREVARRLKLPHSTLRMWVKGVVLVGRKPFSRLRHEVEFTDAETALVLKAIRRRMSDAARRGKRAGAPQSVSAQPPQRQRTATVREPAEVVDRIERAVRLIEGYVPQALAAHVADGRYVVGAQPYILTKENFREVDAARVPPEEIERFVAYVVSVATELNRLLLIVAQVTPDALRHSLRAQLAEALDELWGLWEVVGAVVPLHTAELVQMQRASFRKERDS